jgi:Tol biopolymer transport system component
VVLVADDAGMQPSPDAGPPPSQEAGADPDVAPGPDVVPTPIEAGLDESPINCIDLLPADIRARSIAFDSDRARNFGRQIYVMKADGSNLTQVMMNAFNDKEPSFHPDGASMTFTSDRDGVDQVYYLNGATGQVTRVTNRPEGADQSNVSRDGAWVAYHSGASVYVAHLDGSGEQLVATGLDDFNAYFWPHFGADGSELVFDRNNEIDAAKIGGMGFRQIVQNTTTTIKSPAVSPDGREVAYHVFCEMPGESIWTTPFGTKTDACKGLRVTPLDGTFVSQRPAWGTATYLAYEMVDKSANVGSIAVISRELGSAPCVLTPKGTDNRNPSWGPKQKDQ